MKTTSFTILLIACIWKPLIAQVNITIDSTTRYQTIEGWGHGGSIFSNLNYAVDPQIRDSLNHQYLDFIAHDLGLTGSRMWEVGPRIDGTGMDNGDCDSIDWTKFQVTTYDSALAHYAVYFKNLVNAEGYQTSFYSSPTYATAATAFKPWVLNHPGERAQQIWADALWWKRDYGIDINYDVIFNEPSGSATPQLIAEDIKAVGPRLVNLGLTTKTQYAEAVAPQTDWNYITPVQNDSDLWPHIGRLSYHNYGTADPYRADIRDFGKLKGIPTAQTEMGNPTIDDLFNDLIFGGVTYWEVGFAGQVTLVSVAGNTGWTPSSTYFRMRQLLHYIRPGDIRIGANSSDSLIRTLAFNKNGRITTIILNNKGAQTINLNGLPPGSYGLSQSSAGTKAFQELGVHTVGADGKLSITLGASGIVATLYPYSGQNLPPTIMTWSANPGYLVAPASTATLSVTGNDVELDQLTYTWSVVTQPPGANAAIISPSNATTAVSGLSVSGIYVFKVSVSDGVITTSRKVYLIAYASNPPPVIGATGFRFGAPYGLVFGDPSGITHANIELPVSSTTLQAQIGDLANSDFTGRGKWTLVSQPLGANTKLDTTYYRFVSIRAEVSNMIIPGDYAFQVNITDPGHPDPTARVICTVHPASSGPVIGTISATPSTVILPQSTSQLSAFTSDPQGQLLRHWWAIKSVPAGAKPLFDHQGLANSNVSGLAIPGNYVFTLRAFDDLHMTTKDVSITVKKNSGGVADDRSDGDVEIYPNPAYDEINIRLLNSQDQIMLLTIVNTLGQSELQKKIEKQTGTSVTVDLATLRTGIYYLMIQTGKQIITKKLLKQ